MANYIRKLPIAQSGRWKHNKIVLTNSDLKKITKVNHDILKAKIKTYEIPLILTHKLSSDEALEQDKVFGYVEDVFYDEDESGIGRILADVKLFDDHSKPFKDGVYRQFSWLRDPATNRLHHLAVVGNQAIPIANIGNASFEFMSAEECSNFEYCEFEFVEQEENMEKSKVKESKLRSFVQWLVGDEVDKPEELSEDVKVEKEELENEEVVKTETLDDDISKKLEAMSEEIGGLKSEMEALSLENKGLKEEKETLEQDVIEKENKEELTEIKSKLGQYLSERKISPSSMEKLEELFVDIKDNAKALSSLKGFLDAGEYLSFDDENVVSSLKIGKGKVEKNVYDPEELRKEAMSYIISEN